MLRHVLSLRGTRSRGISQLPCQRIQEHLLPTMEQQSHAQGSLGTLQHWGLRGVSVETHKRSQRSPASP